MRLEDTGSEVRFAVKPPDTSYVKDLKAIVDAGEEIGVSFEFYPGKFKKVDGVKVWTDGRLDQINFVDDPAFQGTSVILNSAEDDESVISQLTKIKARTLARMV